MKLPFVKRSTYDALCRKYNLINERNCELVKDNDRLRNELYIAEKNDQRDPKTGRFVKRK